MRERISGTGLPGRPAAAVGRTAARRASAIFGIALVCLAASAASGEESAPPSAAQPSGAAPTAEQVQQKIRSAGYTDSEARERIEQSKLSPAEIQQRLRDSGLPANALDPFMRTGANVPAAGSPAGATGDATGGAARDPRPSPDKSRGGRSGEPAGGSLEPFGSEIFGYSPSTFEPLAYGPVDPEYPVGPGDELVLTVWGDDQLALSLTVNREGGVVLPEAGQVIVNGLTLEAVRARLRGALGRVYSGLNPAERRPTTFMDVSLGRLRSIQVFILGDVVRPGGYTVSAVSRVLNALYAAGGPTRAGSMREVRVMRGHRIVTAVDLYDYVLGGDTSKETRLENGDVIFVPPCGVRVALYGPVRRAAIYELEPGERLRDLLRLAGGVLVTADLERAQVDRVVPFDQRARLKGQDRIAIDVPLGEVLASPERDVELKDLDAVLVFAIGDSRTNTVVIAGQSVRKPGTFEFHPGMRLLDLVQAAGGVTPDAYLDRAQITRTLPDRTRTILRVDLERALQGAETDNPELEPLDAVDIASRWSMRDRYTVTIDGMVRSPGAYELLEGMTLGDLLFRAGGLTDDAYHLRAEIARSDSSSRARGRLADTLSFVLDGDYALVPEARTFPLVPHDAVFVRRNPEWALQQYVSIAGEVKFPGRYALSDRGERVADLVRRAGGFTLLADGKAAQFTRGRGTGALAIRLDDAIRHPRSRQNVLLEEGDALLVPRFEPVVRVEGAVRNPVSVLFHPGMGIGWYLQQASGLLPNADRGRAVLIRANGDVQRASGLFGAARPTPGSRIVVPARPPREGGGALKDVASIATVITGALTMALLIQQVNK